MAHPIRAISYGLSVGFVFGTALEKAKVYIPDIIRSQMLFKDFTMLKMFLMASAVGLVGVSTLETLGKAKRVSKAQSLGLGLLKGYGGNLVGGITLGIGMTISGSCPGTVLAQLGVGIPSARFVLSGGVLAGLSFGYIHKLLSKKNPRFLAKQDSILIDKALGRGLLEVSIAVAGALAGTVFLVDKYFPWKNDFNNIFNYSIDSLRNTLDFNAVVWSPIIAGSIIGLLQVPSYLLSGNGLGASGSYITIITHLLKIFDKDITTKIPYFGQFNNFGDYAQVGSVLGIVLGAYVSSTLGGFVPPIDTSGNSPLHYIFGGFLLIFGARLAGGCTSGHGISGIAKLSVASLITVFGMFGGAIATALLFYRK